MTNSDGLKQRVYQILESGHTDDRLSRFVGRAIITLVVLNVLAAIVGTIEPLYQRNRAWFWAFEVFSVLCFTAEYLCRLWASSEDPSPPGLGPGIRRLRFAMRPYGIFDLLAILPFYLALFMPVPDALGVRLLRLLRILKLARYSPALDTLWRVLVEERRALAAAFLIMASLLIFGSAAVFFVERQAQPEAFGSIPAAMWWALSTITTVGYGDIVPVTDPGRVIGAMVMVLGVGMFALPIGIIASGFSKEIHRRDFMVTWGMVARVPLFSELDAFALSRIANLLRARAVPADTALFHRGDEPDGMYLIASGKVEVGNGGMQPIPLGAGDFFGEMGLLQDAPRMATVRTVSPCRLLVLERQDFKNLMAEDSDLRDAIARVAEQRMGDRPSRPAEP